MSDRRIAARIPVALRAQYRSSAVVVDGVVGDLSRTGMFFRTDAADQLGSSGEIEMDLPDQDEPVRLRATVVRIDGGEEPGMGFEFRAMPSDVRLPLANFMMRWTHLFR